jgi:hypothetical protein
MTRVACVVISAAAACTPQSSIARLADLPSPQLLGGRNGVNLDYDHHAGCFELSSAVHGTIDGAPITDIHRGGLRSTWEGDECDPIQFLFPRPLANLPTTALELVDGETTWSIGIDGLAPRRWTVTAPATVTEGGDVTVSFAPATPGVELAFVFIDNASINHVVGRTADSLTVHIDVGRYSLSHPELHGTTMQSTLEVELTSLPTRGCEAVTRCEFFAETPDPELPVSVVIP